MPIGPFLKKSSLSHFRHSRESGNPEGNPGFRVKPGMTDVESLPIYQRFSGYASVVSVPSVAKIKVFHEYLSIREMNSSKR
jgi:hypothetical protein